MAFDTRRFVILLSPQRQLEQSDSLDMHLFLFYLNILSSHLCVVVSYYSYLIEGEIVHSTSLENLHSGSQYCLFVKGEFHWFIIHYSLWQGLIVPAGKWTVYLITICHLMATHKGSEQSSIFKSKGDSQPSDCLLSKCYIEGRLLWITAVAIITCGLCRQQSLCTVNIYCHNELLSHLIILDSLHSSVK